MRKWMARGLVIAGVAGSLVIFSAAASGTPPNDPPGQGECQHGNSGQECKPDPQPDHGKDCEEHGPFEGGVNEDHCLPTTSPTTTTVTTTTPPPTTTSVTTVPSVPPSTTGTPTSVTSTTTVTSTPTPPPGPTTTTKTVPPSTSHHGGTSGGPSHLNAKGTAFTGASDLTLVLVLIMLIALASGAGFLLAAWKDSKKNG